MNEYYEWAKKNKICTNCYKEKAFNGRCMCPACLDKNKERAERTRSTESREQRRKYIKRKRDLCVTFGVCRECLKRKATIGLKCTECHTKEVKRNKRRQPKVPRAIRANLGLCYFCGNEVIEGKKVCEKCYSRIRNNFGEHRDTSNHIWRKVTTMEIERMKFFHNKKIEQNFKL